MNNLIVIGTVGYDTVETPFGKRDRALGGSASYASVAASFFAKPGMVAVVGEDFAPTDKDLLVSKGVNIEGIKELPGKTFAWGGKYKFDMNEAETTFTDLNTLLDFDATLPQTYKDAKYVFLANTDPVLQLKVIEQLSNPQFIVMDTMNFWIETKKEDLLAVIKKVTVLLMNDGEARMLFDTVNLVSAAKQALALGPQYVIIKKGEHGALLFSKDKCFSAPGYPLEVIKDPTGCGDCFAGGFIGYLTKHNAVDEASLRRAVIYGSVIASFNAEDFSLERISKLSDAEVAARYEEMKEIREF